MKFDWLKHRHIIFDIITGVLLIIIIILVDIFIVKLKSNSAEERNQINKEKEQEQSIFIPIEAGKKVFIPILNFHHIDSAPANLSNFNKDFFIEPDKFETILSDLINNDYRPVFLSEIVKYLEDKKLPNEKIIAITFDDGNEDFYTKAWPILQKLKIKSNIYIMTGVKGNDWITPEQIVELDKSGFLEIGSHTVWHPKLTKVPKSEQLFELEQSKDYLKDLLNKDINVLCYPFGLYNEDVKALAKAVGYQEGLTFDQDAWQNPDDLMELKRISVYPSLDVIKFLEKLQKEN